jgi:hypothetical protein
VRFSLILTGGEEFSDSMSRHFPEEMAEAKILGDGMQLYVYRYLPPILFNVKELGISLALISPYLMYKLNM